jgi:hypothetical protein
MQKSPERSKPMLLNRPSKSAFQSVIPAQLRTKVPDWLKKYPSRFFSGVIPDNTLSAIAHISGFLKQIHPYI